MWNTKGAHPFVLSTRSCGLGEEALASWVGRQCQRNVYLFTLILTWALSFAACSQPMPEATLPPQPTSNIDLVRIDPAALREGRILVQEVRLAHLPEVVRVTGRVGVDENHTARVGSMAAGRIITVLANVGDHVNKGQRLAELHSHEVHEIRAEYAKALAELSRRRGELEFARHSRDRTQKLYELKAASLEQVQRAETDFRNAEIAITSAQADIGRLEEHLHALGISPEGAEEEYGTKRTLVPGEYERDELVPVIAPLTGTVLKRLVSPGTVVSSSDDLFVVSDLSSLWVNAQAPEKYLSLLTVGRQVTISVQAYGNQVFQARISHIGDSLDPDTRTVQVRCQTNNSQGKLKPEMYATIAFELGEGPETLVIPTSALQEINRDNHVFVRQSDTEFRSRQVRLGRQADSETEVLEGLKAGDKVVTTGSFLLKSELLKREITGE